MPSNLVYISNQALEEACSSIYTSRILLNQTCSRCPPLLALRTAVMSEQKSAFDTPWFNKQDNSFFNHLNKTKIPHLVLTAETEDFDEEVTQQWKDEGFDTAYEPLLNGGNEFIDRIHRTGDSFGSGEYYAIVGNVPRPNMTSEYNSLTCSVAGEQLSVMRQT